MEAYTMIRKFLKNILGENFTEHNAKLASINFAIILFMFLLSGIMLFFLPEQISILHTGDTYYPLPSVLAVWLFPVIALIINISFIKAIHSRLCIFIHQYQLYQTKTVI